VQTAPITDLIGHLDALLNPSAFDDYGPNGLQVPGNDAISTVVTGVSASSELFERAAADGPASSWSTTGCSGVRPARSTPGSSGA
jgi:putative NIF3 family GTP cyclohydrolase 1 type 2